MDPRAERIAETQRKERARRIHVQLTTEDPHAEPPMWWQKKGRAQYRALTTKEFQCDECEELCFLADLADVLTEPREEETP